MKVLSLFNHIITLQPSGDMHIEDIHRVPVPIQGGTMLPDDPHRTVIPSNEVSKLRQFLAQAYLDEASGGS